MLEFLPAVFQQFVVILEVQVEAFFARGVELAMVVAVLAADMGAGLIDAAAAIGLQMCASALEQQIPDAVIFEGMDALVRHLPEQVREIPFAARGVDLLCDVGAAGRAFAGRAFVFRGVVHVCYVDDRFWCVKYGYEGGRCYQFFWLADGAVQRYLEQSVTTTLFT